MPPGRMATSAELTHAAVPVAQACCDTLAVLSGVHRTRGSGEAACVPASAEHGRDVDEGGTPRGLKCTECDSDQIGSEALDRCWWQPCTECLRLRLKRKLRTRLKVAVVVEAARSHACGSC